MIATHAHQPTRRAYAYYGCQLRVSIDVVVRCFGCCLLCPGCPGDSSVPHRVPNMGNDGRLVGDLSLCRPNRYNPKYHVHLRIPASLCLSSVGLLDQLDRTRFTVIRVQTRCSEPGTTLYEWEQTRTLLQDSPTHDILDPGRGPTFCKLDQQCTLGSWTINVVPNGYQWHRQPVDGICE